MPYNAGRIINYNFKIQKMKKIQITVPAIYILFCVLLTQPIEAQTSKAKMQLASKETINKEIRSALELWNTTCKSRNIEKTMELFDKSPDIIVVGSDSGEIFKGKEQIENWMKMLFSHRSFSWDMTRVDIDSNGNTAWVFMDGFMIVTTDKGKSARFPYRFSAVLVKVKNDWKWRMFDGAVPGGH